MRLEELVQQPKSTLPKLLRTGHAIDAQALDNTTYLGVSLGLPRWAEWLTWKTFAKTFYRAEDGELYGWNVRLKQTGIEGELQPKMRGGKPRCFGFYGVTQSVGYDAPEGCDRGLLIQYRLGPNARFDPLHWVRDPLVSMRQGDASLLLGWSYVHVWGGVWTPSYFALQRVDGIDYVPPKMRGWSAQHKMLGGRS